MEATRLGNPVYEPPHSTSGGGGGGAPADTNEEEKQPALSCEQVTTVEIQQIATQWATLSGRLIDAAEDLADNKNLGAVYVLTKGDQSINDPYPLSFVCKQGEKVQGYALAYIHGIILCVSRVIAHPERSAGKGIKGAGSLLVQTLEQAGRAHGATLAKVYAAESAIGFYNKQGYYPCEDESTRKLWKSIDSVIPLDPRPPLEENRAFPPHTPLMVLAKDVESLVLSLMMRVIEKGGTPKMASGRALHTQIIAVFEEETVDAAGNNTRPLEGYFQIDVGDPDHLQLIAAIDSTEGQTATQAARAFLAHYALKSGRGLDISLIQEDGNKRGVSEQRVEEQNKTAKKERE